MERRGELPELFTIEIGPALFFFRTALFFEALAVTKSRRGDDGGGSILGLNPELAAAIRGLGIPGDIKVLTLRAVRLLHEPILFKNFAGCYWVKSSPSEVAVSAPL